MALSVVERVSEWPDEKAGLHAIKSRSVHMDQYTIILCSGSNEIIDRWQQGLPSDAKVLPVSDIAALKLQLESSENSAILLDMGLFGPDALASSQQLIKANPSAKIIALSPLPNTDEGLALVSSGAKGYCNRYIAPEVLAKVVDVVEMGEVWLGSSLTIRLLENLAKAGEAQVEKPYAEESDARLADLTAREQEIAKLIGTGAPNKVIAAQLDITDRTVKAHLSAIFKKTQTKDRLQLGLLVNTSTL